MTGTYHIAQVNIARMNAPLDDPIMEGFVARLDEINALADRSPGFVWRLQNDPNRLLGFLHIDHRNSTPPVPRARHDTQLREVRDVVLRKSTLTRNRAPR